MKIEIIITDITTLGLDAIVNAANSSLMGGGGVDGAIHKAAGIELKKYCSTLGGCKTGQAVITPAFNLTCKNIIHTVGPVWNNGTDNEENDLENCYNNCLKIASDNHLESIAFPCISTGAFRFPFDKAANIAYNTISKFLESKATIKYVYLVVFSQKDFDQYNSAINKLKIDNSKLTTLYRPIGQKEYDLIVQSGFTKFPPRLDWQPIFYPVLNQPYAEQIAFEWNTEDEFSGYIGYVTAFDLKEDYLLKYPIQNVGGIMHNELWVPANELEDFNNNIIGNIRVVKTFFGKKHPQYVKSN